MANIPSMLVGARQEGRKAAVAARPETISAGIKDLLVPGTITEVTGDTYTVAVGLDPDDPEAEPLKTYTRVYLYPEGELEVGDEVWLIFQPGVLGDQQPVILNAGGGGCAAGLTDFGVLID